MEDADTLWIVIADCEDQYAIWPASRPLPPAWRAGGVRGSRQECETYIETADKERDPRVLRQRLEREVIRP
jgi:MbtH protein